MKISAKTKICIIIGDPIEHSLSPAMHNAAYKKLGIGGDFVYLGARVDVKNIGDVVRAVRVMGIRGLTCTIPHKIEVMKFLDCVDPTAEKIGAVNSVVNDGGVLKGFNTDWQGCVIPLEKITSLKNKKVAVLGAGGAARAIVYGLTTKGAKVTIFNRTEANARILAEEFKCGHSSLEDTDKISGSEIIINSTSVGMVPLIGKSPISSDCLNKNQIVFDIVYAPKMTELLKRAKAKGAKIIFGADMLLYQGVAQFELYTGKKAPVETMRRVLWKK